MFNFDPINLVNLLTYITLNKEQLFCVSIFLPVEPRVCGRAVLPAELPGGGAAELSPSKPLPVQPRRRDGDVLQPPKQEAQHTFTERQCPSTHAAFDSPADAPPRPAGAQHYPHPASQHQVTGEDKRHSISGQKIPTFLQMSPSTTVDAKYKLKYENFWVKVNLF